MTYLFTPEEGVGVEVAGAEHHYINIVCGPVLEEGSLPLEPLHERPLLDGLRPVEAHGFGSPGADDPLGAVLDGLECDVLGGVAGAHQQQRLTLELTRVTEVVSVEDTAREPGLKLYQEYLSRITERIYLLGTH